MVLVRSDHTKKKKTKKKKCVFICCEARIWTNLNCLSILKVRFWTKLSSRVLDQGHFGTNKAEPTRGCTTQPDSQTFRNWCPICIAAKGWRGQQTGDMPHAPQQSTIQLDYCFMHDPHQPYSTLNSCETYRRTSPSSPWWRPSLACALQSYHFARRDQQSIRFNISSASWWISCYSGFRQFLVQKLPLGTKTLPNQLETYLGKVIVVK